MKRSERVTGGWTGLTLLRREATKGWSPRTLMRFDDEHLRRHALHDGFKWIRSSDCVMVHHAVDRGVPGPLKLHWEDGYNAWKVLPLQSKLWMVLNTPLFIRHGTPRFKAPVGFLDGMFNCMTDEVVALLIASL